MYPPSEPVAAQSEVVLERTLSLAGTSFKRAWPLLFVAAIAIFASSIPGGIVSQVCAGIANAIRASGGSKEVATALTLTGIASSWILSAVIAWPVTAGAYIAAVRAQRGHTGDFGAILAGFRRFVPVVGANLIVAVLGFIPLIPFLLTVREFVWFVGVSPGSTPDFSTISIPAAVGFGLVGFCVSIWIGSRCAVALIRAADPDLPRIGPIDAVRFSFERTRGNTLNAIGVMILAGTVSVLSLLLCCVGIVLVGMPLALALFAGFYRALLSEPDPAPPAPPQPWGGAAPPQFPV